MASGTRSWIISLLSVRLRGYSHNVDIEAGLSVTVIHCHGALSSGTSFSWVVTENIRRRFTSAQPMVNFRIGQSQ